MSLKDFVFLNKLGDGSFSQVFKVRRISDNQEYALKKVQIANLKEKEKLNALNEIRILASINHPCIIAYKDAFFDEQSNTLCIIMEFAEKGDLSKKIDQLKQSQMKAEEKDIWIFLTHVLQALQMLHSNNILHRDIKSANIFINKENIFKLGDMNVSKVAQMGLVYTQTGTPYYASPEVWRDEPYDTKSDIWSFGCVAYEYIMQRPPFKAKDMDGLFQKVQKGQYEKISDNYSQALRTVIAQCLTVNQSKRPSAEQILNSKIFQSNSSTTNHSNYRTFKSYDTDRNQCVLLSTIKMPKNLKYLRSQLPQAKYNEQRPKKTEESDRDKSKIDPLPSIRQKRQLSNYSKNPLMMNEAEPLSQEKIRDAKYQQKQDLLNQIQRLEELRQLRLMELEKLYKNQESGRIAERNRQVCQSVHLKHIPQISTLDKEPKQSPRRYIHQAIQID